MHDLHIVKTFIGSILGFLLVACGGADSAALEPSTSVARLSNVAGAVDGAVAPDRVRASTGQLRRRGYAAVGTARHAVTVAPGGKFAYAANFRFDNISVYSIDPASGALTEIAGSPFAAGDGPRFVAFDPSGKFAYVANYHSGNVSAYAIDPVTGALTAVAGSPVAAGDGPYSIAVDPSGRFAYVTNLISHDVSSYRINAITGALSALDRAVAGDRNSTIAGVLTAK